MTTPTALDTSVAIPMLVATHEAHDAVRATLKGSRCALAGHAVAETYAVLTRLPGDLRLDPKDAARLLDDRFEAPLLLGESTSSRLPAVLGELGIAGGATYDSLVALAAREHQAKLATRDGRAAATYAAVGVEVVLVV